MVPGLAEDGGPGDADPGRDPGDAMSESAPTKTQARPKPKSLMRGLFLGHVDEEYLYPFPEQDADERENTDLALESFRQPIATLRVGDMHELDTNRTAISLPPLRRLLGWGLIEIAMWKRGNSA